MATKSKSNQGAGKNGPGKRTEKQSPDVSELLVLELQEIYSAENQLSRALPRFAKSVESEKLQKLLEQRLQEGQEIVEALDSAFEAMEQSPGRKKNVAAEGLINDMREHVQEIESGPALDTVLIGAIQKTEHYCIAAWGTSRALAQSLEEKAVVKAMERALKSGKKLDEQLTELAAEEILPQLLSSQSEDNTDEEETDTESEDASEDDEEEEETSSGRSGSRRGSGSERRAPN